jgi:hypothetical protein
LFQNLALPGLRGDIDHLVVGPTGLFVLETKNVAGLIQLDREGWRREKVGRRGRLYEAYMDDPLSQVRRNVRALRLYLQRHAPALCASTRLWITELIVFPHPKARLRLADTRVPAYELAAVAPAILGHRPAQRLAPGTVGRLVSLLQAAGEAARGAVPGFPADAGAGVVVVPEVGAPAGPPTGEAPAGTGALGAPYGVVPPAAPPGAASTVERGNALLETALVVPLLLTLGLGVVGVGRLTQAQMGVRSVAREAARSAVLATSGSAAVSRGLERAYAVAAGYGLRAGALRVAVEPGDFVRGGAVRVDVTYDVTLDDLPFLQWTSLRLSDFHVERIDLYQSRR